MQQFDGRILASFMPKTGSTWLGTACSLMGFQPVKGVKHHTTPAQAMPLLRRRNAISSTDKILILGTARDPVDWLRSLYRHNKDSDEWGAWVPDQIAVLFPTRAPETFTEWVEFLVLHRKGIVSSLFDMYNPSERTYVCRLSSLADDFLEFCREAKIKVSSEKEKQIRGIGVMETFDKKLKKIEHPLDPRLVPVVRHSLGFSMFEASQEGGYLK